MDKVVGNIESKSRKGNGIKVDGEWYSTYSAADLDHVNWKDEVEFLYETKGRYKNIQGKVTLVSKSESGSGSGGVSRPYNNLGVEVGHAANLAIQVLQGSDSTPPMGTSKYYQEFGKLTVDFYKVMKTIRAKVESADGEKAPKKEVEMPDISDDEDLFG